MPRASGAWVELGLLPALRAFKDPTLIIRGPCFDSQELLFDVDADPPACEIQKNTECAEDDKDEVVHHFQMTMTRDGVRFPDKDDDEINRKEDHKHRWRIDARNDGAWALLE